MTLEESESLDRALEGTAPATGTAVPLLAVGDEVRSALQRRQLSPADRAQLYAEVLRRAGSHRSLRRVFSGWRTPAIVGGGLVTAGAIAAIAVALARGRRQPRIALPA